MGFEPWVVVVIIGILCVVFSWFSREPQSSSPVAADFENALDLVTVSLEEENRKLLETMGAMKQEYALRADAWEAKTVILEKQIQELKEQMGQLANQGSPRQDLGQPPRHSAGQGFKLGDALNGLLPEPDNREEKVQTGNTPLAGTVRSSIRRRYPELFQLNDEGKSIEQIARKIGLSKGEAALILQLAKQEEENYA